MYKQPDKLWFVCLELECRYDIFSLQYKNSYQNWLLRFLQIAFIIKIHLKHVSSETRSNHIMATIEFTPKKTSVV